MAHREKDEESYRLLDNADDSASDAASSPPLRHHEYDSRPPQRSQSRNVSTYVVFILAVLASLGGGFMLGCWMKPMGGGDDSPMTYKSPYLNLEYSQPDVLWWNTEYSPKGEDNVPESEVNRLWDITIPWESGIIALSNEEAESMGLPDSQPFPWDGKNKKIYIINAHHLLHCVRNIYISIQQYRTNTTQTIAYPHILHCLDSLRQDTMCNADDTPRYVPPNDDAEKQAHGFRPGDGQPRQCRDWGAVQEFVRAHDPCYRYQEPGNEELSNLHRFKYCPEGSPYLDKIRGYFGYEEGWVPEWPKTPKELEW